MTTQICRVCGHERLDQGEAAFFAEDVCSVACADIDADNVRPTWTPEAAARAAESVVTVRQDPARCGWCQRPLPPRTGQRGRPRKTCGDECARRLKARRDTARVLHDRVRFTTEPDSIAGGSVNGSLLAYDDLDRGVPLRERGDGEQDERDLFGEPFSVADAEGDDDRVRLRVKATLDRSERHLEDLERRREARWAKYGPRTRAAIERAREGVERRS